MEFVGTKEAARILECTPSYVAKLCREGKFNGAEQDAKGSPWRIPIEEVRNYRR